MVALSAATVGNEQMLFIFRKRQTIGVVKVVCNLRHFQSMRVDAVNMASILFHAVNFAFVVGNDAVVGVCEPNGMVRLNHHIVGGVQSFAIEFVGQHRDAAIVLSSCDTPVEVLARDQASLQI